MNRFRLFLMVVLMAVFTWMNISNLQANVLTGYRANYYNLPNTHPDMEGTITGLVKGMVKDSLPLALTGNGRRYINQFDWYDQQYLSFSRVDPDLYLNYARWFPIDGNLPGDPYHFAVHWQAVLTVPTDGEYEFQMGSDDDSWLFIDGQKVFDLGGVHGLEVTVGKVFLTRGSHDLDIYFAERHQSSAGFYFRFTSNDLIITPGGEDSVPTPPDPADSDSDEQDIVIDDSVDDSDDPACNVEAYRTLLPYTFPGSAANPVSITIDILDETKAPSGLIVIEYVPVGWTVTNTNPPCNNFNPSTGEIKWVFSGTDVLDKVITYQFSIPVTYQFTKPYQQSFNGHLLYLDPQTGTQFDCPINGIASSQITLFNPYDDDQNWEIGDFELLDAINDWANNAPSQDYPRMVLVIGSSCDLDLYLLDLIDLWSETVYVPAINNGDPCFPWASEI